MQPRMHDRRGAPMKIGLAVAKCCWHEMEMVTPATCGTQGGTHPPEKGRIPDSWNAWDSLGEIHFGNRTWNEAARCYRKAKAILEKDAKLPPAEKAEQIKRVEGVLLKIQEGRS